MGAITAAVPMAAATPVRSAEYHHHHLYHHNHRHYRAVPAPKPLDLRPLQSQAHTHTHNHNHNHNSAPSFSLVNSPKSRDYRSKRPPSSSTAAMAASTSASAIAATTPTRNIVATAGSTAASSISASTRNKNHHGAIIGPNGSHCSSNSSVSNSNKASNFAKYNKSYTNGASSSSSSSNNNNKKYSNNVKKIQYFKRKFTSTYNTFKKSMKLSNTNAGDHDIAANSCDNAGEVSHQDLKSARNVKQRARTSSGSSKRTSEKDHEEKKVSLQVEPPANGAEDNNSSNGNFDSDLIITNSKRYSNSLQGNRKRKRFSRNTMANSNETKTKRGALSHVERRPVMVVDTGPLEATTAASGTNNNDAKAKQNAARYQHIISSSTEDDDGTEEDDASSEDSIYHDENVIGNFTAVDGGSPSSASSANHLHDQQLPAYYTYFPYGRTLSTTNMMDYYEALNSSTLTNLLDGNDVSLTGSDSSINNGNINDISAAATAATAIATSKAKANEVLGGNTTNNGKATLSRLHQVEEEGVANYDDNDGIWALHEDESTFVGPLPLRLGASSSNDIHYINSNNFNDNNPNITSNINTHTNTNPTSDSNNYTYITDYLGSSSSDDYALNAYSPHSHSTTTYQAINPTNNLHPSTLLNDGNVSNGNSGNVDGHRQATVSESPAEFSVQSQRGHQRSHTPTDLNRYNNDYDLDNYSPNRNYNNNHSYNEDLSSTTIDRSYSSGDQINGEFTAISRESIEQIIQQIFDIPNQTANNNANGNRDGSTARSVSGNGNGSGSGRTGQVSSIYFEMTIDILDIAEGDENEGNLYGF